MLMSVKRRTMLEIVRLIGLDAIAPAILGGLAGGLGRSQRMHQLARLRVEQRHTDADGHVHARLAVHRAELLHAFAQGLRKLRGILERRSAAARRTGRRRCARRMRRAAGAGARARRAGR